MNAEQLKEIWKKEEDIAHIRGWDFSHIHGRYTEEVALPWDFREIIRKYRKDSMKLLDMETGGGEFLLSLGHPKKNTAAIEDYPPNAELCKEVLPPLGIDFKEWEFPGFSVESSLEQLYKAQETLEKTGMIEGSIHRFYIAARKK